jgi:hypothetical protein
MCSNNGAFPRRLPALLGAPHGIPKRRFAPPVGAASAATAGQPTRSPLKQLLQVKQGREREHRQKHQQSPPRSCCEPCRPGWPITGPLCSGGGLEESPRRGRVHGCTRVRHQHRMCCWRTPEVRRAPGRQDAWRARNRGAFSLGYFSLGTQREVTRAAAGGSKALSQQRLAAAGGSKALSQQRLAAAGGSKAPDQLRLAATGGGKALDQLQLAPQVARRLSIKCSLPPQATRELPLPSRPPTHSYSKAYAAAEVCPWNCSSSVEPLSAVVEDCPPWMVWVTVSK